MNGIVCRDRERGLLRVGDEMQKYRVGNASVGQDDKRREGYSLCTEKVHLDMEFLHFLFFYLYVFATL